MTALHDGNRVLDIVDSDRKVLSMLVGSVAAKDILRGKCIVAYRAAKLHGMHSHGDYELEGLVGGKRIVCQLHLTFLYAERPAHLPRNLRWLDLPELWKIKY